jgi:hypothetical protein
MSTVSKWLVEIQSPKHKMLPLCIERVKISSQMSNLLPENDLLSLLTSTRLQMNKKNWPALFEIYPNLFPSSEKHEIGL